MSSIVTCVSTAICATGKFRKGNITTYSIKYSAFQINYTHHESYASYYLHQSVFIVTPLTPWRLYISRCFRKKGIYIHSESNSAEELEKRATDV